MVNVNSQIPFNLHNQTVSPGINPSSSRSTSMSTNRYAFHDSTTNPVNQYRQNPYPNVLITPVDSSPSSRPSRQPSRSPSPFVGENDAVIYPRNPILNVRLVGASSGSGESGRTGRARERVGDTENKEPNTTGLGLDLGIKIPHDVGRGEDDLDATPRPHGGSNQPDQIDTKVRFDHFSFPISPYSLCVLQVHRTHPDTPIPGRLEDPRHRCYLA
jgi:hypothetical protein